MIAECAALCLAGFAIGLSLVALVLWLFIRFGSEVVNVKN